MQLLQAGRFADIDKLFVRRCASLPSETTHLRGPAGMITTQGSITVVGTPLSESRPNTTIVNSRDV